jgi:OmpA-OmpF porin, OOP family
MKKSLLFVLMLIVSILINAQNADKKWAIGLGGGYVHNLGVPDHDIGAQFYFSRYLSPSFDIRLNSNVGFFINNPGSGSPLDNLNPSLDLRFKLYNGKILPADNKLQPYIYAGAGYLFDNAQNGVNFNAGIGTKLLLKPNVALFGELGYIHGINTVVLQSNRHDNFLKAIVGIEIAFGKSPDADRDGIPDSKDKCPDTPRGVKVDKDGCPLDTDGDGILNSDDKCPDVKGLAQFQGCPDTDGDGIPDHEDDCPTVAGLKDLNGCPDKDGDGIADHKDECPDVAGVKEFNGCPDTDGDGIPDHKDDCPTVAGLKELKGCPDADGDGVPDHKDQCPDTPKGATVDEKGCPKDSDGDGVYDGLDKCPDEIGTSQNMGCPDKEESLKDLNFPTIYFATNSYFVTDFSKQKMESLIKALKEYPKYSVKVTGFADVRGVYESNLKLSQNRADAAANYLKSKNISPSRMVVEGKGEDNSGKETMTEEELQKSRRVEFILFAK